MAQKHSQFSFITNAVYATCTAHSSQQLHSLPKLGKSNDKKAATKKSGYRDFCTGLKLNINLKSRA